MNPILLEALGAIVRWTLTLLVPFFVTSGIWTADKATEYVAAASLAILALGWSLWQKYRSRLTLVTALSADHPLTEEEARAKAKLPTAPSTTTPVDEVPKPTK